MARRAKPSPRPEVQVLEDRSVPATLTGMVYADSNGNGVQDVGEAGLAGVTVQLDTNSEGRIDATTTTDANGTYTFTNIPTGRHTVLVVPPLSTTALGSTTIQAAVTTNDVTVTSIALRPNGKASGTIYADLNGNNVQDANEPGLPGIYVALDLHGDGSTDFNTTSGVNGTFLFSNVPDGFSKITVNSPVNYTPSSLNTTNAIVSNGNTVDNLNFGERPTNALTGKIYLAASQNGSTGLSGITVALDAASDGKSAQTTTTNADGIYLFANVPVGIHSVSVVAPAGSQFVTPDGTNKLTTTIAVTGNFPNAGNVNQGLDVGVSYPGSVSGKIYRDVNGDGVKQSTERNISPGTITVDLNGSGKLITVTPTIQPDGSFRITGLPDGTHYITVTPLGGLTASASATRQQFVITNGAATTIPDIAVIGNASGVGNMLSLGSGTTVKSYNFSKSLDGTLKATEDRTITTPGTTTNTRVVSADFNGDGVADTITATGGGGVATIRIYDGVTGAELVAGGIQAFEDTFKGGVNISAGDFNGDGKADIVAAADTGGGPRVRVFNAAQFQAGADTAQGKLLADFFGIDDTKFRGGVRATVGDLNKDGTPDLVIAAGVGGGPRIAIFDGKSIAPGSTPTRMVADFFAFEPGLRNGANIAIGDVNGDGQADLVTTAGSGGAPRVTVFSGAGIVANQGANSTRIADFYVNGDTTSRRGTQVTVKDVDRDGRADVVATDNGRAYVFTSANISANYVNPQPNGPSAALSIDGFGDGNLSLG